MTIHTVLSQPGLVDAPPDFIGYDEYYDSDSDLGHVDDDDDDGKHGSAPKFHGKTIIVHDIAWRT